MSDKIRSEFDKWFDTEIFPNLPISTVVHVTKETMYVGWLACAEKSAVQIDALKDTIEYLGCQITDAKERAE